MNHPDAFHLARRDLVKALCELQDHPLYHENTLAARNVQYHADELLKWIDVFYGLTPPPDDDA